ncbi:hydrogenase expression/formation protein HypE [Streptomyces olivoverticillatus]|uniref:Hydrogenase expression/formation protein HypE n=1 Tax=Streptomyces olivoverticillatus TaxID=66427 RepID=A0A7W7PJP5_9ACTN|nr:AIR synthase related protein [Streptomyces olivoverticillatus]MBB4892324.1 hydrogenase expression/formation protein HypE [Streptomyces olivoverticillatus]
MVDRTEQVALSDDGTGRLTALMEDVLADAYAPQPAALPGPLAIRTDSCTVDPPFFGNGDIGRLAVCHTVNGLAATGAEPRLLTLAVVVEAGLPLALLRRTAASVRDSAREAGVTVTAVDTRVVRAGELDRLTLSVTALGAAAPPPPGARPGDRILLTGPVGDHAAHILSLRAGLGYEHHVPSDCAPLPGLLSALRTAVPPDAVRAVLPVTDGGLAEALHRIDGRVDGVIPVRYETQVALEALGVDVLDAACAGVCCVVVTPEAVGSALTALRSHRYGRGAALIGEVAGVTGGAQGPAGDGPVRLR